MVSQAPLWVLYPPNCGRLIMGKKGPNSPYFLLCVHTLWIYCFITVLIKKYTLCPSSMNQLALWLLFANRQEHKQQSPNSMLASRGFLCLLLLSLRPLLPPWETNLGKASGGKKDIRWWGTQVLQSATSHLPDAELPNQDKVDQRLMKVPS